MKDPDEDAMWALTRELRLLNSHRFVRIHNSIWRLLVFQLLRGLAMGLGTVMGATVLVSLLAWWASQFSFIPIIGDWMNEIMQQMEAER